MIEKNDLLQTQLSTLGYDSKWLKYGILTFEMLQTQFEKYNQGEDTNAEHYRYVSFKFFLENKKSIEDIDLEHFIELAMIDKDQIMAGAALTDVFKSIVLTDSQFLKLSNHLRTFGAWAERFLDSKKKG